MVAVFLQKEAWRTLSNISMEMDEESLADVRRDDTIKTRCVRFGVDYIERHHGETSAEQQQRHNTLKKAIERERKRRARAQQSAEERRSTQDANTAARKRTRAQQSPEERRSTQDADTAARKRTRAQALVVRHYFLGHFPLFWVRRSLCWTQ
eukprot:scaffold8843_cov82-Skeletonema_dohrnii-CCMP3373.AAC.1